MIPSTSPNDTTLVLRRTFLAERARVFRAWITPKALESWLRPGGMNMTVRSLDARAGGSFCFDLENGGSIAGTYLHLIPPEKLVFTWSGGAMRQRETVVTLEFFDQGSGTEVVLTHERLNTPELRVLIEGGWFSMLNALASILSSSPSSLDL